MNGILFLFGLAILVDMKYCIMKKEFHSELKRTLITNVGIGTFPFVCNMIK